MISHCSESGKINIFQIRKKKKAAHKLAIEEAAAADQGPDMVEKAIEETFASGRVGTLKVEPESLVTKSPGNLNNYARAKRNT